MSLSKRRKRILKEIMYDKYKLPTEEQQIVRVKRLPGGNLLKVESATEGADDFLVSIPTKYRKTFYVHRGYYILVNPIVGGTKVKAELCKILYSDYIREYTKAGVWPEKFCGIPEQNARRQRRDSCFIIEDNDCGDEFVRRNPNRLNTIDKKKFTNASTNSRYYISNLCSNDELAEDENKYNDTDNDSHENEYTFLLELLWLCFVVCSIFVLYCR